MPRRRAGAKQHQPQPGFGNHLCQTLRQRIQAGVVGEIRAELARQIALRKGFPHGLYRALLLVLPDQLAETLRHHHSRVGTQAERRAPPPSARPA